MKMNQNYLNLKDSYLFSTINQEVTAYTSAHPEKRKSSVSASAT